MHRYQFAPGDAVFVHRTGGSYQIIAWCVLEKTSEDCYAYRAKNGVLYVRPAYEMEDGRFTLKTECGSLGECNEN